MLSITCFTTFQATRDGQPITRFRSAKERALLFYLAVEQDRAHQRTTLAGLLWPDEPEATARHNLAQTLLNLRKAIGDSDATPPYLLTTAQTIAFNPASDQQVDVNTFLRHLAVGTPTAQQKALTLYRGPFLADFSVTDSDLLENWIMAQRERLQQQALAAFTTLCAYYESAGELQQAQQLVRRLLVLTPWQEEAHRQLMRLLALTGERTLALAQYDTLTQVLLDELGVAPAAATDALYDQILAGEIGPTTQGGVRSALPALPTPPASPFQALSASPYFVGRTAEVAQLQSGLTAAGAPIWAVVGMGGAGKSTLAAQLCHQLRGAFADGVLWANAASSTPLEILATWARAYGYDFSGLTDLASRAAAVRGLLAAKRVLIVLDNVLEAANVQPLLPGGVNTAVLLTTRDRDVAHALNAQTLLLGELSPEGSRLLLASILGEERVQREEGAAAQIGALLHYLPLAVEIVAQRLKSRPRQPLAQMAARLGDEQQRLGLEISDRVVRASFEVSWSTLDEELQRAFTLPAVFRGRPFTATAIAYLAAADVGDVEEWLYALETLSLVRAEGDLSYRQHPLLADFAAEKLIDAETVSGRMVEYYLGFAQENQQQYAVLEPEWSNLAAALEVAHHQARWAQVLDLTDALAADWQTRGRYSDARHGLRLARHSARELADPTKQATTLLRWGEACLLQNDYDEAAQLLTNALQLSYELEDHKGVTQSLYHLGRIAVDRNQYEQARKLLDECLTVHQGIGDQAGRAAALYQQARIEYDLEEFEKAQQLCEDALAFQEKGADQLALIPTLRLLAQIHQERRQDELALACSKRGLQLSQALQNTGELATMLYTLTYICRRQKKLSQALTYAEQGLKLAQESGLLKIQALIYFQISTVQELSGNIDQALTLGLLSANLFQTIGDYLSRAYCLLHLCDLYQASGELDKYEEAKDEARRIAESLKHKPLLQAVGR